MTTRVELITAVRRRVGDPVAVAPAVETYADTYFVQALEFAVQKLNFDFGTTYSVPTAAPDPPNDDQDFNGHLFLIQKLATIEMCYIRATESPAGGTAQLQSLTVPNLTVSTTAKAASDVWFSLAEKLQKEYDGELESDMDGGDADGTISETTTSRQSLRTGGERTYEEATEPDARVVAVAVVTTTATVSWDIFASIYFGAYEVWRSPNADMSGGTREHVVNDNHTLSWADEGLASGTYYYKVVLVDRNGFEVDSNIVTAVVS